MLRKAFGAGKTPGLETKGLTALGYIVLLAFAIIAAISVAGQELQAGFFL